MCLKLMTNRILDFSQHPAHLNVRGGLLVIQANGFEMETIPFEDIAAVVVSHRQVQFTHAVLSRLADAGAMLIACNDKMVPSAMLLPFVSHFVQTERFLKQARLAGPKKKRLWQHIVRAKVLAQAAVLRELRNEDAGLPALARTVGSGDPRNIESQAARRYWSKLFDDSRYRRGSEEDARNAALDYGYAVLRSVVARALCAAGLHPSLGIHHVNKLNPFALADDLMEPFRPAVDRAVVNLAAEYGAALSLKPEVKRRLIESVTARYRVESETRTLFDIYARASQSLAGIVMGDDRQFWLPSWEVAE